jgi:hypothetical protein
MKKVKSPSDKNEPAFIHDIKKDGYHVYSLKKAKIPNFYPPELPRYPGVSINSLEIEDVITIRIFFGIGKGRNMRIDGGVIDLQVEEVHSESVMANILTALPEKFLLKAGGSIEIFEDEILYKADSRYN